MRLDKIGKLAEPDLLHLDSFIATVKNLEKMFLRL